MNVWGDSADVRASILRTLAAGVLAFVVASMILGLPAPSAAAAGTPVPVIVDTDIFGSVDDVGALAVAFVLQQKNEAKVIAVGVNKRADQPAVSANAWKCAAAIAQFYNSGNVPIGTAMPNNGTATADIDFDGPCAAQASPSTPTPDSAVNVYRQALVNQPANSVVMVTTGYLGSMAALLGSAPDSISPLNGHDLVAAKVKMLVVMGGGYPSRPTEHNLSGDVPASQDVVANWPTKMVFSGYEVGDNVHTGQTIPSTHPASSPVRIAYGAFVSPGNWYYSYDLTAVYHAIRPADTLMTETGPGTNTVDSNGGNSFTLGSGNDYYLTLGNADTLGSTLNSLLETQPLPPDTTAPAISAVAAGGVTQTGATITWTTDEDSDTQVEYGKTTGYGSSTTLDSSLATSHSRQLTGLTAGTVYHYRVKSRDAAGNLATSPDATFTTAAAPDTTPPTISAISVGSITTAGATIVWTTNEASDTQVEYGPTTSYGSSTTLDSTMTFSHSKSLSGLTGGTLYHYRVKSKDAAGNLATSADGTFSTIGASTATLSASPTSVAGGGSTTVSWDGVGSPTIVDWIGLYKSGALDTATTKWFYTSTCTLSASGTAKSSGSCSVTMPAAAGTYEFRLFRNGGYVKLATSGPLTVTGAADTTAPTISGVSASSITSTGATIAWSTNEAADTQVEYGTTTSYGNSTTLDTTMGTSHSRPLSGLTAATLYHYRVKSKDAAADR